MVILLGDSAKVLKDFNDECIDLTVTSPPYDNLRTYEGYSNFDFKTIAQELFRVTKKGGIVVWIVGDATINGDETGSSFRQAVYFKEIGFKLSDTMICHKNGFAIPSSQQLGRYHQTFEFMFLFSKGKTKTFNPIIDRTNSTAGEIKERWNSGHNRGYVKSSTNTTFKIADFGMRHNVWNINTGNNLQTNDKIRNHPGIMSEQLATDLIKSWSNEGDLILDPFMGSGTTAKAAHQLNRKWVGIEINPNYIQIAKKRLEPYYNQSRLLPYLQNE